MHVGDIHFKHSNSMTISSPQNPVTDASKPCQLDILLTRLHAGYFLITLSFASQALLWKLICEPMNSSLALRHFPHILPSTAFLILWFLSLFILVLLCFVYLVRCFYNFYLVKAVFSHHIGVNYFYAPWISWLFLIQSAPKLFLAKVSTQDQALCWLVFVIPIVVLDVKIYGQWVTTERRFLSLLANPASLLSLIGNLVGAQTAAHVGLKESAICLFSLGMMHYLVLFVTLYQRLSGAETFPATLRPVFFLFFAAPSMASLAWKSISGTFDIISKMLFFLSLFLFISLACRPVLFKKSMRRYHVAWWNFSFPLTFLALASVEYAREKKGHLAPWLMLLLFVLSVMVFLVLMLLTALKTNRLLKERDPNLHIFYNSKFGK